MSGKQYPNRQNRSSTGTAGVVATVATAVIAIVPAMFDKVRPMLPKPGDSKKVVTVPQLYKKGFPLELDQATEILANINLKTIPSKLNLKEAHPRYKDCFDMQVVSADPKPDQKVDVGSSVVVRYVTQDVIDESQRIFDEEERQKKELAKAKAEKRKAVVDGTVHKVKHGASAILPGHKKGDKAPTKGS